MEQNAKSSKITGPVWGVIIVAGLLAVGALLALMAAMFGMDVPGLPS